MSTGLTLADAQAQLTAWVAASAAVANSQSYKIGQRSLTYADASEIRKMIDYWRNKCRELDTATGGGSIKVKRFVLRDN